MGKTTVTLERGVGFFEDGSEVAPISPRLIKAAPRLLKLMDELVIEYGADGDLWEEARSLLREVEYRYLAICESGWCAYVSGEDEWFSGTRECPRCGCKTLVCSGRGG
jgi:hypothetical protein